MKKLSLDALNYIEQADILQSPAQTSIHGVFVAVYSSCTNGYSGYYLCRREQQQVKHRAI
jgi:hypothetical protein